MPLQNHVSDPSVIRQIVFCWVALKQIKTHELMLQKEQLCIFKTEYVSLYETKQTDRTSQWSTT